MLIITSLTLFTLAYHAARLWDALGSINVEREG
jgi:hypothetical protein